MAGGVQNKNTSATAATSTGVNVNADSPLNDQDPNKNGLTKNVVITAVDDAESNGSTPGQAANQINNFGWYQNLRRSADAEKGADAYGVAERAYRAGDLPRAYAVAGLAHDTNEPKQKNHLLKWATDKPQKLRAGTNDFRKGDFVQSYQGFLKNKATELFALAKENENNTQEGETNKGNYITGFSQNPDARVPQLERLGNNSIIYRWNLTDTSYNGSHDGVDKSLYLKITNIGTDENPNYTYEFGHYNSETGKEEKYSEDQQEEIFMHANPWFDYVDESKDGAQGFYLFKKTGDTSDGVSNVFYNENNPIFKKIISQADTTQPEQSGEVVDPYTITNPYDRQLAINKRNLARQQQEQQQAVANRIRRNNLA